MLKTFWTVSRIEKIPVLLDAYVRNNNRFTRVAPKDAPHKISNPQARERQLIVGQVAALEQSLTKADLELVPSVKLLGLCDLISASWM